MAKRKKKQSSVLGKYQSEYSYQRSRIKDLVQSYSNRGYIPKTSTGINSLEELIPSLVKERRKQGTKITAKEIKELKSITGQYIQKITEYIEPETGRTISGFQGRTYERKQAALSGQAPTPELKKLQKTIRQTTNPSVKQSLKRKFKEELSEYKENKVQAKKDFEYQQNQKDRMVVSYAKAIEENNTKQAEHIRNSYRIFFNEDIEDNPLYKDSVKPEYTEPKKEPPKGGTSPVDEDYWEDYYSSDYTDTEEREYFTPSEPTESIRDSDEYAEENDSKYYDIVQNITELLEESFYIAGEGFTYRSHHRGKSAGVRPYDTTRDKNTALGVWEATINRYSHTKRDRDFLMDYAIENESRIGDLLNDIQYAQYEDDYSGYFTELLNKLNVTAFSLTELQDTYDGYAY